MARSFEQEANDDPWLNHVNGPRSWDELDFEMLGATPPRSRGLFRADGQDWDRSHNMLVQVVDLRTW